MIWFCISLQSYYPCAKEGNNIDAVCFCFTLCWHFRFTVCKITQLTQQTMLFLSFKSICHMSYFALDHEISIFQISHFGNWTLLEISRMLLLWTNTWHHTSILTTIHPKKRLGPNILQKYWVKCIASYNIGSVRLDYPIFLLCWSLSKKSAMSELHSKTTFFNTLFCDTCTKMYTHQYKA